MIPILLLAFWLGARSLSTNPVWGDEINSLRDAGNLSPTFLSPAAIWTQMAQNNPMHTPGYFVMLEFWAYVAGWSREALRLSTVLCGVAGLAWTYRLGRDLFGPRAGLYGAAIMATSMLYVHYLTKIRMYENIALLTAMTLCLYFRIIRQRQPGKVLWLLFFLGTVGLLYTHYIAALVLVAIGIYHLLFVQKNRRWWQVVAVMALAGLLFLPWLSALLTGVSRVVDDDDLHEQAMATKDVVAWLAFLFTNGRGILLVPPLLVAGYAAWRFPLRRAAINGRSLWFFFFVIFALILVVNVAAQMIVDNRARYLMALWPLLALLVGFALTQVDRWRPWLGTLLWVVWLAFGLNQSVGTLMSQQLDGFTSVFPVADVVPLVNGQTQTGDFLLLYLPDTGPLPRRYQGVMMYYFAPLGLDNRVVQRDAALTASQSLEQQPRVWLAYTPKNAPSQLATIQAAIRANHTDCDRRVKDDWLIVELYARTQAECSIAHAQ